MKAILSVLNDKDHILGFQAGMGQDRPDRRDGYKAADE